MKHPGTIVNHDGQEYLLLEAGYNAATRAVNMLSRPGNRLFPQHEGTRPVTWMHQGEWFPVARWSAEEMLVPDKRHAPQREMLLELVTAYVAKHAAPPTRTWATTKGEAFHGRITDVVPMGVAVVLHDSEDAAQQAAHGDDVVPVSNVGLFLTHLVREGYAGALWSEQLPVFFCVDGAGDLQFLRVGGSNGKVKMELLDTSDAWEPYEGAEEIEILDNREACDERLVRVVGKQPLLDWSVGEALFSVGPREEVPGILDDEGEGLRFGALFTDFDAADAYREESGHGEWSTFPVRDLQTYMRKRELAECVVQINPGQHRAHSGILWNDGETAVLDSFSGFWRLAGGAFESID